MENPWLVWFVVLDVVCLVAWLVLDRLPRQRRAEKASPLPDRPQVLPSGRVLFCAESDKLPADAAAVLAPVAEYLTTFPKVRATVVGSADDTGNLGRNRRLARARAQAVVRFLVGRGIDPRRVAVVALEPTHGATESERARLRSATIL